MTDFISDGQPFETPLSGAVEGYANTPPTFGRAFGAMFEDTSTTGMVNRAVERGQFTGSSNIDRALFQSGLALAYGQAGIPALPTQVQSPMLSAADANKRYAPKGAKITDAPLSEGVAQLVGREKAAEIDRESVLARYEAVHSWPVRFGTGMAAFVLDPTNAATMFLPGVGEETALGAAGRVGLGGGFGARVLARLTAGGTSGAIAQAPLSAARYALGREEASDYDLRSAFTDMAYSAAGGAILHAGFGGVSDATRRGAVSPDDTLNLVRNLERSGDQAVSPAGAIGRYQIMPGTAREYGFDPAKLTDPAYNEQAARAVIADLRKRYGGDLDAMLVAYNAGPGRADQWLKAGRNNAVLKPETRAYLARAGELTGVRRNLAPDAFTQADAMRSAVSQVVDGREVDVSPVFAEHDTAAGQDRTSLAAGAPPVSGTWESVIEDIAQKHVRPDVGDIAAHYDLPRDDAAKLLNDLATRPDSPIELAAGRGANELTDLRWRLKSADRVEDSMRRTSDYAWRMYGVGPEQFPSTAAFVDHLYRLQDLADQSSLALSRDPAETVTSQREMWSNGFAPGIPQAEFEALHQRIYGAEPPAKMSKSVPPQEVESAAKPAQRGDAQLAMLERALAQRTANGAAVHPEDAAVLEQTRQGLEGAQLREQAYAQAAECLTEAAV